MERPVYQELKCIDETAAIIYGSSSTFPPGSVESCEVDSKAWFVKTEPTSPVRDTTDVDQDPAGIESECEPSLRMMIKPEVPSPARDSQHVEESPPGCIRRRQELSKMISDSDSEDLESCWDEDWTPGGPQPGTSRQQTLPSHNLSDRSSSEEEHREEYNDATDRHLPQENKQHRIDHKTPGDKTGLSSDDSVLDFFLYFLNEDIVHYICLETNRFNLFLSDQTDDSKQKEIFKKFKAVKPGELYIFLAVSMLMARVKKIDIKEYWTKDYLLTTPIFGELMGRDRYLSILKFLHFSDNNVSDGCDCLFKIRYVLDNLRQTFKNALVPFENKCIDESLSLYKGTLFFKQFIPGIKSFVLCGSKTGYVLDYVVHTGNTSGIESSEEGVGKSGEILTTLLQEYLNKGHSVFVDDPNPSPSLSNFLGEMKSNARGTVNKSRKRLRKVGEKLRKEEIVATDGRDMLLSSIECLRKTVKWYKKLFFQLLDLSILNAHTLYKLVTDKKPTLSVFHRTLIGEMVTKYHSSANKRTRGRRSQQDFAPMRLTGRHFLKPLPPTKNKKKHMKKCVVCTKHKLRRETRYYCQDCNTPLCLEPCFEKFHTKTEY